MKVYELIEYVTQDPRIGNFWTLQQVWTLHILKRIEMEDKQMAEIKVGFRAIFYKGDAFWGKHPIKESYEEAVKDIEQENKKVERYNIEPFTHAQVEKVYYRH